MAVFRTSSLPSATNFAYTDTVSGSRMLPTQKHYAKEQAIFLIWATGIHGMEKNGVNYNVENGRIYEHEFVYKKLSEIALHLWGYLGIGRNNCG